MAETTSLTWKKKSDYFKNLTNENQERYIKKLTLGNGTLLPDPCTVPVTEWKCDETLLLDISHPDITFYLVETPSEFTRDKVRAYKSLEAYNFYLSGHVQDFFLHKFEKSDYLFIKSEVLPSQHQGQTENLYKAWIALHKAGILTANCTCKAG